MDNKQVTAEWIAKQRAVCAKANEQIFSMEKARAEAEIVFELFAAALDALEAVYAENTRLTAELAAEKRRADAAVEDMKLIVDAVRETHCDETCCFACKFDCDTSITDSGCYANECPGFERDDCFEWRGPTAANTDAPTGAGSEGEQGTPSNMKLCEKCGKLSVYDHYFRKFICTDCQHSEAAPSGAWEGDK